MKTILSLLFSCAAMSAGETVYVYSAHKTDKPPKLDGVLDDECWKSADVASNFVRVHAVGLARNQSSFRVLYDDENFYVALDFQEADMTKVRATLVERDSAIWTDDSYEIYFDPGHSHMDAFRISSNLKNARGDVMIRRTLAGNQYDAGWGVGTGWRSYSSRYDKGFCFEIVVPFHDLGLVIKEGDLLGFQVERISATGDFVSVWSPKGNYEHIQYLGHLYIGRKISQESHDLFDLLAQRHGPNLRLVHPGGVLDWDGKTAKAVELLPLIRQEADSLTKLFSQTEEALKTLADGNKLKKGCSDQLEKLRKDLADVTTPLAAQSVPQAEQTLASARIPIIRDALDTLYWQIREQLLFQQLANQAARR